MKDNDKKTHHEKTHLEKTIEALPRLPRTKPGIFIERPKFTPPERLSEVHIGILQHYLQRFIHHENEMYCGDYESPEQRQDWPEEAVPISDNTTYSASVRCVSFLWDSTLIGNPFGTDGPKRVPRTWPGDTFTRCRQWHGIDLSIQVDNQGRFLRETIIVPGTRHYVGNTVYCGVVGRGNVTDQFVSAPTFGNDARGNYVEVRSLLGSRLGVLIPDIDVGLEATFGLDLPLLRYLGVIVQQAIEEAAEDLSEETYTGTNKSYPRIFSYILLRIYEDGTTDGRFVSDTGGNGFLTQDEIITGQIGYSLIPEHHLYLNGRLTQTKELTISDRYEKAIAWIDTYFPYEEFAFLAVNDALIEWCKNATDREKRQLASDFKSKFPDYYVSSPYDR